DLNRKGRTRTADTEYFFQRLEQEIKYSSENGLSFSVILLQTELNNPQGLNESVKVAESLIRECDLVFTSDTAVAILLAEADESGASAFLKGFNQLYKSELPHVTCRFYQQQPDFIRGIEHLLDEALNNKRAWEKPTLARLK